jgi:hypothetical protein
MLELLLVILLLVQAIGDYVEYGIALTTTVIN